MNIRSKLIVAAIVAALTVSVPLGAALADADTGTGGTMTCADESFQVRGPMGGSNPVFQVSATSEVLLATDAAFSVTGYYQGEWTALNGQYTLGPAHGRALGLQDKLQVCTDHWVVPDGTFPGWSGVVFDYVITLYRAPQNP